MDRFECPPKRKDFKTYDAYCAACARHAARTLALIRSIPPEPEGSLFSSLGGRA